MKKSIISALFLFTFALNSSASLESDCSNVDGRIISNTKIKHFSISSILNRSDYGFYVGLSNGYWYRMLLTDNKPMIYREEIASTARLAKVLGLSVNVCVKDPYIFGLQLI